MLPQGYSGYGMPTSGFSPVPGVAMFNSGLQQSWMQDMQYAMANHQRTQGVLNAAAMAFTGGQGDWNSMWNDEATRAQASLLQTGVYGLQSLGLMGGSSPFDLYAGMQSAVAGSQFGVTGLQGYLMGSGAVTSDVTRELYDAYQADFYSATGAANTRMTAGFNDIQMGSLFQQLGQRGAFAGMQSGTYGPIGQDELENRRAAALALGNTAELERLKDFTADTQVFQLDEGAKGRINAYVSSAAQTLGILRDIFGDRPMQELMQQAEHITGENFVAAGPEYIRGRLEQTRGMARAYGIDEGAMMNFNTNTTSTIDAVMAQRSGMAPGSFRQFAAAVSPLADENALIAYNQQMRDAAAARERGEYMPTRSLAEIAALSGAGIGNIALEETEVSEAAQALELFDADPETRAEIMQAMSAVGAARSPQERAAARDRLSQLTQQRFGISKGELQGSLLGADGMLTTMSPEMREFIGKSVLTPSDQNRMSGNFDRIVNATNMVERSGAFANTREASDYMQTYMQSFNTETRRDIINALNGPNAEARVREIVEANAQYLPDNMSAEQFIQTTMRQGVGGELEMIERLKPRYAPLSNMISRQEQANSERMQLVQAMRDGFFGSSRTGSGGLGEGVWQGLLGGGGVTDSQVLDFMSAGKLKSEMMEFQINEDGSLNVDEAQARAFAELAGDNKGYLMQRFNLAHDDYAGLARAMSSVEGHAVVNKFLGSSGMVRDYQKSAGGGRLRVGSAAANSAASQAISDMADAQMYSILTGDEISAEELESVGRRALSGDTRAINRQNDWKQTIHDRLVNNADDYLKEFDKPDSGTAAALRAYAQGDQTVLETLRNKETELREAGKTEEADKLKELRNKVGAAGDGAARETIDLTGTVKILGDGNASLALKGSPGGESLTG